MLEQYKYKNRYRFFRICTRIFEKIKNKKNKKNYFVLVCTENVPGNYIIIYNNIRYLAKKRGKKGQKKG